MRQQPIRTGETFEIHPEKYLIKQCNIKAKQARTKARELDSQQIDWIPNTTIINVKRNILSDRVIDKIICIFDTIEHKDKYIEYKFRNK